jgi:hypothetical protein
MRLSQSLFLLFFLVTAAGCLNMPTPPSQITGTHVTGAKYDNWRCDRLQAELDSLLRRERQLVQAQRQRIKTSEMQAFWWGYGEGDGIEASELATVRGEIEAVRKTMERKGCTGASPEVDSSGY